MNKIKTSIDQIKPRLVQHVNASVGDLVVMLRTDAEAMMDRGEYEDAVVMLQDIAAYKKDAAKFIEMVESTNRIGALIHNIEDNLDWFGVYFMEDTLELMSVMFDATFEVDH